MPSNAIKGPESEKYWKDATDITVKQYPGLKSQDPSRFYATVMSIYKKMCKNKSCGTKNEDKLGEVLGRLEMLNEGMDYVGWQLWDPQDEDSKKLTKDAVKELNGAVKAATMEMTRWMKRHKELNIEVPDDELTVGAYMGSMWRHIIMPVLDKRQYRKVGIREPEPSAIAGQKLIDTVKKFYGIKGFTSLGDYI